MPVDPQLRSLKIDIPAQPDVLVKLSLLITDQNVNLQAVGALIAGDMALASSVLKAVNSSFYGLTSRVRTVQQAITYLGMREIKSVTFAMGLRAVFPHAPELVPLWQRASVRAMLMSRIGQAVHVDPWAAHSAGLFEECGKAVLFRHAPDHYRSMLRAAVHDGDLVALEHAGFGVSHDALGAALCDSWGLAPAAVASVRQHVLAQAGGALPEDGGKRAISALSVVAFGLMADRARPDGLGEPDDETARVAQQAGLDAEALLRVARLVREQLAAAVRHRRSGG